MTQPTQIFANLDFEYEWSAHLRGQHYQCNRVMRSVCTRWSRILGLLPVGEGQPRMWGLTPSVMSTLSSSALAMVPSLEAVAQANNKCFSHRIEAALGVVLPGACLVDSEASLERALASSGGGGWSWVLKHPWGVSGRERVQGKPGAIDERHRRWVQRQLKHGDTLIFEPWLTDVDEFSMHFEVHEDGSIERVGVCRLVADATGTHRGNACGPGVVAPDEAWDVAQNAVAAVADVGYFGPVGIDAMWGELCGSRILRPLMEINARVSFGRLALALGQLFSAELPYAWWHPSQRELREQKALLETAAPFSSIHRGAGLYQLPDAVDPNGQSGTYLLVGA